MVNVSIDINIRNESIKSGDQIITICKCLVLVYMMAGSQKENCIFTQMFIPHNTVIKVR